MKIDAYTWKRDSNELIDYEISTLSLSSFTINASSALYRYRDSVELTSNAAEHLGNKDYFKLCEIKSKKDKYYYIPNSKAINGNDLTDLSWFVYKGKKYPEINKQYRVKEGDVIKIGRVWLVIKEIKINSDKVKKENIVDFDNYSQEF